MEDLNQVQKALEEKAKKEVIQIVENFIKEVNQMNEKYSGTESFYLGSDVNKRMYVNIYNFRRILINSLIERHSEQIVRYKAKELLNKLELI